MKDKFEILPIGVVRKKNEETWLEIFEQYEDGLLQLEEFSHLITLWWISKRDTINDRSVLQTYPHINFEIQTKANVPLFGVFATRSPKRPNPIGITIVKILHIKKNKIYVDKIDAFSNTPIIDLKPYIPNSDCILNVKLPIVYGGLIKKKE